ncbi:helix-turn-helix transcriptional regulator [Solirubrobacter sp. CPCC 204708]|uniref:Helix-turn-helix transcriptional regulator n=1 Tax=Solirubrobacter deserti TaxID=2282478 RepID=A0ABT4RT58_9ACTN|nr:helix-turn-helix transcriptional regulator [Solirubrobacter deserti]MBE2319898.1 helix-turn-helix transcriptional regulator [Solirubrobacter deserti]MDA0141430.1 helix-turn-helix transcriptional regulator [Solirubrobacter deserti]
MSVGPLIKTWRTRRRLSQLDLALEAGVSARHLSFVETGRSRPSEQMLLHLAEHLEVPLRERNRMLLAAGYAPVYAQRPLDAPELAPIRGALDQLLTAHEPFPAVVVDRHSNLVAANAASRLLTEGVAPHLLEPPVNVLKCALHPEGMAPRIENLAEWRAHLLGDLAGQRDQTGDEALAELYDELAGYPGPEADSGAHPVFVPLKIDGLTFLSTRTTFGTAVDVTVSELAIEAFFPADEATFRACSTRR